MSKPAVAIPTSLFLKSVAVAERGAARFRRHFQVHDPGFECLRACSGRPEGPLGGDVPVQPVGQGAWVERSYR